MEVKRQKETTNTPLLDGEMIFLNKAERRFRQEFIKSKKLGSMPCEKDTET